MFIPFPKILSLRNLLGSMSREHGFAELGPVTFIGQPKLHGTNAGITLTSGGALLPQSRRRALSIESDNYDFASFVLQNEDTLISELTHLVPDITANTTIYGEWVGPGIQRGVSISQIDRRRFIPFAVKSEFDRVMPVKAYEGELLKTIPAFNASQEVIFNPATEWGLVEALEVIEASTKAYEEECPVAAFYEQKGMGEGLVWWSTCGRFIFKSKGEKHRQVRKPLPTPKDPAEQAKALAFAEMVVTPARMEGAYEWLKEMGHALDRTSTGKIIPFVLDDVRAECIEEFKEADVPWKAAAGHMAALTRNYFFAWIDAQ